MNRKFLAVSACLCLLAGIFVGVAAQTSSNATTVTTTQRYTYGEHGEVILQLPPPSNLPNSSTPSHPTNLRLIAIGNNNRSSFGAFSSLIVALWIPVYNTFVPVAQINSVSKPELDTYLQTVYNNTPIWNPLMHNIINLNSSQNLNVWREDRIIIANLTTPVTITLPFNLMNGTNYAAWGNQTFTLPPLTLIFHPIAPPVPLHEAVYLAPPFSGYTIDTTSLMSPAWVRADIPLWVKGAWLECSGHICTEVVQTGIPPTT